MYFFPLSHPIPSTACCSLLRPSTGKLIIALYRLEQSIGINTPQLCTCDYIINFPLNKITSHNAVLSSVEHFHNAINLNKEAQSCPSLPVNVWVSPTALLASPVPRLLVHVHISSRRNTSGGLAVYRLQQVVYRSCNTSRALSAKAH